MKHIMSLFISLLLTVSLVIGYTEITHQDDHFVNVSSQNYVLVVFHNPKKNPKVTKPLKTILETLSDLTLMWDNKVVIELISTTSLPFFDSHYDLEGRDALLLFIRNQIVVMKGFEDQMQLLAKSQDQTLNPIVAKIEQFVEGMIDSISVEIKDLGQLRELITLKRITGIYTGSEGVNFKKFMHVARKNLDFNFAHTFDKELTQLIFKEFSSGYAPDDDSFSVLRHSGELNEFDNRMMVTVNELGEKDLTEFLEYERFDKLRGSDQGNAIFSRIALKTQPLLLFIQGENKNSYRFNIFKEAVKELPKKLIYSYTDNDSTSNGAYYQLFMLGNRHIMQEDSLTIIWMTNRQNVRFVDFNQEFTKEKIKTFVLGFLADHDFVMRSMRSHLYHNEDDREINTEEL